MDVPVTSKSDIQPVKHNRNRVTVRVCVYETTPACSVLVLRTESSVGWEGKKRNTNSGGEEKSTKQYYRL